MYNTHLHLDLHVISKKKNSSLKCSHTVWGANSYILPNVQVREQQFLMSHSNTGIMISCAGGVKRGKQKEVQNLPVFCLLFPILLFFLIFPCFPCFYTLFPSSSGFFNFFSFCLEARPHAGYTTDTLIVTLYGCGCWDSKILPIFVAVCLPL